MYVNHARTTLRSAPITFPAAIRALKNYPRRIKSFAEARSIRGVGLKTAQKVNLSVVMKLPSEAKQYILWQIQEILQTGELQRIKYERSEDVLVTRLFQGIYGVGELGHGFGSNNSPDWVLPGQATAFQWYAAGCRKLEDLRRGKGGVKLSVVQKIGLKFYDGQYPMKQGTMAMLTDIFSERYQ